MQQAPTTGILTNGPTYILYRYFPVSHQFSSDILHQTGYTMCHHAASLGTVEVLRSRVLKLQLPCCYDACFHVGGRTPSALSGPNHTVSMACPLQVSSSTGQVVEGRGGGTAAAQNTWHPACSHTSLFPGWHIDHMWFDAAPVGCKVLVVVDMVCTPNCRYITSTT